MLAADQSYRPAAATNNFCWSCGVPDPGSDTCAACGVSSRPKPVSRSALIGATASIRQRLRSRSGLVVAESATSALLAFPDGSVSEASREKLGDLARAKK